MGLRQLTYIIYLAIFLLIFLFASLFVLNYKSRKEELKGVPFCAAINFNCTSGIVTTLQQEGKELFNLNCAQCHAKNMKSSAFGPPLENTFSYWVNDTLSYQNYLNGVHSISMVKKEFKKINHDSFKYHFSSLTKKEVEALLAYINLD